MNERVRWLDEFVKWFFNASPVWVDESKARMESPAAGATHQNRRAASGDRRRNPDLRAGVRIEDHRSDPS